jgi:hypothetical protein
MDNEGNNMSDLSEITKSQVATPADVERRLIRLSKEIDEAHSELIEVESHYNSMKAQYEISMARSRMLYANKSSPAGKNYTVTERDDMALLDNEELHLKMATTEAQVKASRGNMVRIKTQVDITRSVGSSVRASFEI